MFGCSVRTAALAVAVMVACMAIGAALTQMTTLTSADSRLKSQMAVMQGQIEKQAGLQKQHTREKVPLEAELGRLRKWLLVKQPAFEKQLEESKAAFEASEARVVERDATVAKLKGELSKLRENAQGGGGEQLEGTDDAQLDATRLLAMPVESRRTVLTTMSTPVHVALIQSLVKKYHLEQQEAKQEVQRWKSLCEVNETQRQELEESQLKAQAFQQALDDGRTLLPMNVGCYTKKTKVDCCKSIDAR